jgi:glutathione synthase/RimK-type ligase-like ATP-grasp enzyme
MRKKVLILTQAVDAHANPVLQELERRNVQVLRFDLSEFPTHIEIAASLGRGQGWQGWLRYEGKIHALEEIQSVWNRRPTNSDVSKAYIPPIRAFLNLENLRGFLGILQGAFWVSPRSAIQAAEFKPVQLQTAQAAGLAVPRTLITTNPESVGAFFEECGGSVISKAVAKGVVDIDKAYLKDEPRFMFTSQVLREDLEDLEGVRVCAHLFQEKLSKMMDLRVVVIGRQIFTVGIHAHSQDSALDWRKDYANLSYSVEQFPPEVERKLLAVVRAFGLQYSSADFLVTPDGQHIFIELNPNGQFSWLASATGLPMIEAMANLLQYPEEYGV